MAYNLLIGIDQIKVKLNSLFATANALNDMKRNNFENQTEREIERLESQLRIFNNIHIPRGKDTIIESDQIFAVDPFLSNVSHYKNYTIPNLHFEMFKS
jgi:hypothetical protein